jgi:hypothetical protein
MKTWNIVKTERQGDDCTGVVDVFSYSSQQRAEYEFEALRVQCFEDKGAFCCAIDEVSFRHFNNTYHLSQGELHE